MTNLELPSDSTQTDRDIWDGDLLGREADARFIIDFVTGVAASKEKAGKTRSLVLNIDTKWGGGKSFFLKRLSLQLRKEQYVVAAVNAWRDDHSDDPLVAIMAEIDNALRPYLKKETLAKKAWIATKKDGAQIVGRTLLGIGKSTFKRYVGATLEEIIAGDLSKDDNTDDETSIVKDAIHAASSEMETVADRLAESLIAGFVKTSSSIESFRDNIGRVVSRFDQIGMEPLLFVLVDELDRCRPTYAVQLLERMKHLFEVDGVCFVVATDTSQLRHTVAGAYGGGQFDGLGYLNRFFDRRYEFAEPDLEAFVAFHLQDFDLEKVLVPYGEKGAVDLIASGFAAQGLGSQLRSVEQILGLMATTVSAWRYPEKIELCSLLLLASAYHRHQNFILDRSSLFGQGVAWEQKIVGDRYVNRKEPLLVDLFDLSYGIQKRAKNLTSATTDLDDTYEGSYISRLFSGEFNRKSSNWAAQHGPSVQIELKRLLANAGRLGTDSTPDEN